MLLFLVSLLFLHAGYSDAHESSTPASISTSGRIFSNVYVPTHRLLPKFDDGLQQFLTSAWLQTRISFAEQMTAQLLLTATEMETSPFNVQRHIKLEPREAYVSYLGPHWELRAGRIIQVWGQTDGYSPTDLLTAKDLTLFNPDDEIKRRGFFGMWFTWTPQYAQSWNFTGVIAPAYAKSKLLLNPQLLPTNMQLIDDSASFSSTTLNHTETALQISYAGIHWDMAFIVFRGWNHSPFFSYDSQSLISAPTQKISLQWNYQKILALGVHGSKTIGESIYRWESVYVIADQPTGLNYYSPPSHFDLVFGVERAMTQKTRIQLQYISKFIPTPRTVSIPQNPIVNALEQRLASVNAQLQNYQNRYLGTFSSSIQYLNEDHPLSSELHFLVNLVGLDYLVRPQMHYAWSESLKITTGFDIFGGPTHRPLGALKPYNSLSCEFSYIF